MKTLLTSIALCLVFMLTAQDSTDNIKLQKHYYRSELVSGPIVILGSTASLSYAVYTQHITSGYGIGGLAGIVLGSIVFGLGIDDYKDFKNGSLQVKSQQNQIGFCLNF